MWPPDLNQLSPDTRFGMPPGGAVLASSQSAGASAPAMAASSPDAVAPNPVGTATLKRSGTQRWILSKDSPEQIWPRLERFWADSGFTLARSDAPSGVMETDWAENRANLKKDFIRESIGKLFDGAYDSGLRDRYIVRVERMPEGTEIYLAHRGLEEFYVDKEARQTRWQPRASDPELEAVMLARLLRQVGEAPQAKAEAPVPRPAATLITAGVSTPTLEIDDSLANTWRRVSVALDRAAYPTLTRDRRKALLVVEIPKEKKAEAPKGFLTRLFSKDEDPVAKTDNAPRQRVMLEEVSASKTRISVLSADGQADSGDAAKALAQALLKALN